MKPPLDMSFDLGPVDNAKEFNAEYLGHESLKVCQILQLEVAKDAVNKQ